MKALLLAVLGAMPLSAPAHADPPRALEASRFADLRNERFTDLAMIRGGGLDPVFEWRYPALNGPDPVLGYGNAASTQVRHIARTKGKILFDVVYTNDAFGRRVSPSGPGRREKFLILTGCSFTYGVGVNDHETLSYYLGQDLPDHQPYNYGIAGVGTVPTLVKIEAGAFSQEVPEKTGTLVYVFLGPAHAGRNAGVFPSLEWLKSTPYYEWNGESLVQKGTFESGRKIRTWLYLTLGRFLRFLGRNPRAEFPATSEADNEHTCRLITQAKNRFEARYPGAKFLVYVHPLVEAFDRKLWVDCFSRNQIAFHFGVYRGDFGKAIFPGDGHPTAYANALLAADVAGFVRWAESAGR